ncbi:MAG: hypothetical protein HQ450_12925 [Alcaligenaceae bacterium]|nr:hypothetical protein [Alcaligenaceae bacterium]
MGIPRNTIVSALVMGLLSGMGLSATAVAQTAAPAPDPSPLTANVSLTSDYRFRGISQSNLQPAIQGGFDYAHPSGFYVGNWNSSISWISDAASAAGKSVSAPIEMNFYAGYKYEWSKGFTADVGVLQYYYPTSGATGFTTTPNTTELYAAQNFTFDSVTGYLKFSYGATTFFGFSNSAGSNYTDLTVNYDTGVWGLTLNAHAGYQYVAGTAGGSSITNDSLYSYTDWKLGATKDFGSGLSLAIAYIGTNAKKGAYINSQGKALGGDTVLATLTKTF